MSFMERAKQAAEQARQAATDAARQAGHVAADAAGQVRDVAVESAGTARQAALETTGRAQATLRDPATKQKAQESLKLAKKGIATAVERIDPGVLADIVIKATSLQEKANAALRAKGSPYRISEIGIGAAIPPSITFAIGRLDDPDHDPAEHAVAPHAGVQAPAGLTPAIPATITTLDGTEIEDVDLTELADGG